MTTDEISSNVPMRNLPAGVFPLSLAFRHSFAIRYSTFIICFASAALSMLAETPPSAKDILASVRLMESRQELDLQGQLRQNDVVIPFQLVQNGPLMRMEGYDWNAQLTKRFEVVSAQKIEGRWFLKQMRVEEFQPGTNHVQARTYLEIKR